MKRTLTRIPALVLACLMVLSNASLALAPLGTAREHDSDSGGDSGHLTRMSRAAVTITSIEQLAPFFPDENFRAAVFKAVEGQGGASVEDALAHFTGDVIAKNKGIRNIRGLEKLRWANKVDLTGNLIQDLTVLSESGTFSKDYYGEGLADAVDISDRAEGYNVYWVLDKNPFTHLPASFGGRLVIKQMATAGIHYPPDDERLFYLREAENQTFDYTLNIARCRIDGESEDNNYKPNGFVALSGPASVVNMSNTAGARIKSPDKANNKSVEVNLLKSGKFNVATPVEQVFHYDTADEFGSITPGSVSFKYYIEQPVTVYDRLTMTHTGMAGTLNFTKTNPDGQPLAGAVYDLYQGPAVGTPLKTGLTTSSDGKITVQGLNIGTYTLRETKAPTGYLVGDDVSFVIGATAPKLVLSGGIQAPDASVSADRANEDMVYFAGPDTPEKVSMAFKIGVSHELIEGKINAIYSSLNGGAGDEIVYPNSDHTISDALADLNQRIAANAITGPVKFEVTYTGSFGSTDFSATATQVNEPVPADFDINVTKKWEGDENNDNDRPASVTVSLLGTDIGKTLTLTAPGGWTGSFSGLKAADQNGKLFRYTVKENPVDNYDNVRVDGGKDITALTSSKSVTITNTHNTVVPPPPPPLDPDEPAPFSISVNKVWRADERYLADRPASVTVALLANGVATGDVRALIAPDWSATFDDLAPVDANGALYTYTVKETPVPKYTGVASGSVTANTADKRLTVTNTHQTYSPPDDPSDEPDELPTPPTPPSEPPVTPPATPPEVPTEPGTPISWEFPPGEEVTVEEPPTHGTITYEPPGPLTYTPHEGYHGPDTFTVTTVDPTGRVQRFKLTVRVLSSYTTNPSTGARI